MACPHYEITIVKRSVGESAVAAAAYQTRSNIFNEYRQKTEYFASYKNKGEGLVWTDVLLPENAPREFADRAVLWNSVEEVEDQRNSQLARRIRLTLPNEVPRELWVPMVTEYVREQFVSKGMCVDVAIHFNEPPPNPHAHLLLTMRSIDEQGKWMPKFVKVPNDDGHGNPVYDKNGKLKKHPVNVNGWNDKGNAEIWRSAWAAKQNEYLEKVGSEVRVDLRSYTRQGILKIPTVHLGPAANASVKRGEYSHLQQLNEDIKETNGLLDRLEEIGEKVGDFFAGWMERRLDALEEHELRKRPPVMADVYGWWLIRHGQRSGWKSGRAQMRCSFRDWNEVQELAVFVRENKLYTTEAVLARLKELEGKAKELRTNQRKLEQRLTNIGAILTAAETVKRLQPVHNKSKFGFNAKKFAADHAAELKEYNEAYATLMRLNDQSVKVDVKALSDEKAHLESVRPRLQKKLEALVPQLKPLRKIRKCVLAVETDMAHSERKPSAREELKLLKPERKPSVPEEQERIPSERKRSTSRRRSDDRDVI